jgi:hypothetical protein
MNFFLTITDIITSQTIDISFWITLYTGFIIWRCVITEWIQAYSIYKRVRSVIIWNCIMYRRTVMWKGNIGNQNDCLIIVNELGGSLTQLKARRTEAY